MSGPDGVAGSNRSEPVPRRWCGGPTTCRSRWRIVGRGPSIWLPRGTATGWRWVWPHPDGRYLGLLSLITDATANPTSAACDLVGARAPPSRRRWTRRVPSPRPPRSSTKRAPGPVLTHAGDALPLPGLETHPMLSRGPRRRERVGNPANRRRRVELMGSTSAAGVAHPKPRPTAARAQRLMARPADRAHSGCRGIAAGCSTVAAGPRPPILSVPSATGG